MRHVLWSLAALAIAGVASEPASAAQRARSGYYGYHAYQGYQEYHGYDSRGGLVGYRGLAAYGRYRPSYQWYGPQLARPFTHAEAVRRIMSNYSRDRFNPHPRSYYKSPAWPGYWGW